VVKRHLRRAFAGICLGSVLALAAGPAFAQQAPAAPAAPAKPALPPIAPSHLAVAREVVIASGLVNSFDPMVANIAAQLLTAYTRKMPAYANVFEQVLGSMKPDIDAKKKEIIEKAAQAYARHLDEATLKQILAFMKSPVGVAYIKALPEVLGDVAQDSDQWLKEVATMMGERVAAEMKKRGVDIGR
jgi:hypothetical protein